MAGINIGQLATQLSGIIFILSRKTTLRHTVKAYRAVERGELLKDIATLKVGLV